MAVVLAGLGAYLYFVELPADKAKTASESQEKTLLPFADREITKIAIASDLGSVTLEADDKRRWRITAPLAAEAEARDVEALLRAVTLGKVSRVLDDQPSALAPFGLEKPAAVLTFVAGERQETLSIGDSGPISSTLYALRGSDKKVVLTTLAPRDVLNKTVFTFRKKDVLKFSQDQLDQMRIATPAGEVLLVRPDLAAQAGHAVSSDKRKWLIKFPVEGLADQTAVRTLLQRLEDLKALGFVDPGPPRDALSAKLTKPDARLTLTTGGLEQTVKLYQVDAASGEAYAVTTPESPIYRISPMAIKDFTKELFAFQDKRLLGAEVDDIALLSVRTRDDRYTLVKQSGDWVMEEQANDRLDQEKVNLFVSRVVDLPAELRVVKQAGPLTPYGLSAPSAELTVTRKDGTPGGRLVLGSRVPGVNGLAYAMGQRLPGIFQARSDILDQIPAKQDLFASAKEGAAKKP